MGDPVGADVGVGVVGGVVGDGAGAGVPHEQVGDGEQAGGREDEQATVEEREAQSGGGARPSQPRGRKPRSERDHHEAPSR